MLWQLLLTSSILSGARAEDVRISSISEAPGWQLDSRMHLQLTPPETEALDLTYSVYPLTESAGLNQTEARSTIWIRGNLVPAGRDLPGSERANVSETIAFLSCDAENATRVLNELMTEQPKAVLLYSIDGNSCSLEGEDLSYSSIYTMADSGEAWQAMNNTLQAGGILQATITGDTNLSSTPTSTDDRQNGTNSTVAMSILYAITSLVTVLFLGIIGMGAVRARRYPERYGPRSSGFGGQPRQSRAKGLARAVLETLPIVKFGNPSPAKPDPAVELESQTGAPDSEMATRSSNVSEEPQSAQARQNHAPPMSGAVSPPEVAAATGQADASAISSAERAGPTVGRTSEEHLGCSICTEDFSIGEDVRVLPCHHQFHPPCIDPWLINVSGTCPLCRLDLRQQSEQPRQQTGLINPTDPFLLALPFATTADWNDHHTDDNTAATSTTNRHHRRRSSRLLDLHRLRHASLEERIEILQRHSSRQHQRQREVSGGGAESAEAEAGAAAAATAEAGGESEEVRGRRAARLAERLRERFRVLTRRHSQPPTVSSTPSSAPPVTSPPSSSPPVASPSPPSPPPSPPITSPSSSSSPAAAAAAAGGSTGASSGAGV